MTTKRIGALGRAVPVLLAAAALFAGTAGAALAGQDAPPTVRERMQDRIAAFRLVRMTQALGLTEEQAAALYPPLTRIEKEKALLQRDLAAAVRDLRADLRRGDGVPERDLLARVGKVDELRDRIAGKDREADDLLRARLTPVQRARYVLFSIDFLRGINESLIRVRGHRGLR